MQFWLWTSKFVLHMTVQQCAALVYCNKFSKCVDICHRDVEWWWCWLWGPALSWWNSSIWLRSHSFPGFFLLDLFTQMNFHMAATFVRSGKSPPTGFTSKWLFAGVSTDVSGQVVWAGEIPHADTALEWFLSGVGAHMTSQLVGPRESPWACLYRTAIGSLTWGGAGTAIHGVTTFGLEERSSTFGSAASLWSLDRGDQGIRWCSCGVEQELIHHSSIVFDWHVWWKLGSSSQDGPFHVECSSSLHKHGTCNRTWWLMGAL